MENGLSITFVTLFMPRSRPTQDKNSNLTVVQMIEEDPLDKGVKTMSLIILHMIPKHEFLGVRV